MTAMFINVLNASDLHMDGRVLCRSCRLVSSPTIVLCIIGTARIVCRAVSMQLLGVRPSVRPSVCLSQHSPAARCYCGFAAVGPADRRYRSIAAQPAGRRSAAADHDVSIR